MSTQPATQKKVSKNKRTTEEARRVMNEVSKQTNGHSIPPARENVAATSIASFEAILDRASARFVWCDASLVVRWMNASCREMVGASETFELSAAEMVGESLDVLVTIPAAKRKALRAASSAMKVDAEIAGKKVEVTAAPVVGPGGRVEGYSFEWAEQAGKGSAVDEEQTRLQQMIEGAPVNVMCCDKDFVIRYANAQTLSTLGRLQQYLPIPVDKLVGSSVDVFHKNPSHQRRLLSDPRNLPHRAEIRLGPETLSLLITAIYDTAGQYLGPMLTWEVITERIAMKKREEETQARERATAAELREKVTEMLAVVSAAAKGDLTQETSISGADAIGQMGDGLSKFLKEIRQSISNIAGNAQALAASSDEMTTVSQSMSANAEETSTQANVVSAASEQVNRSVQTVATAAEEMTASIREIAKNATDAARVATQAVKVAETTNTTVAKLGESSAEIGKVIKVITSIAQQTNLLALNATIEAARAGEAGKGFAVVANEVKELAKETAKATEDIGQKIEAIQTDTRGAVAAIAQIGTIINQINDIQNTIASAVEEQTATTNEISRNVAEAAKGSAEIANNITGVAKAAQETSTGASNTQSAASELSRMASELQRLVGRFTY